MFENQHRKERCRTVSRACTGGSQTVTGHQQTIKTNVCVLYRLYKGRAARKFWQSYEKIARYKQGRCHFCGPAVSHSRISSFAVLTQVSTEQLQRMIDNYNDSVFFKALTRRQQEVIVLLDVMYPLFITDGPEEAVDVPLDSKFVPFNLT